ncbi:MAG: hypothetical protein KAW92_12335 [Candidatus Cloacimonetes bacterium]|nr:hypothetical protein [Candidatus Cloacimonadota bacterium]
MSRTIQKSDGKGSLKDIQKLITNNSLLLNALILNKLPKLKSKNIEWLSPLHNDDFAEYSDEEFISRLQLNLQKKLKDFWPKGGPQWDALGKTDANEIFLIEAKANIPEIISPGTGAKNKTSLDLINKSLKKAKSYLNIKNEIDWSGKFYQYTNRISHLYFLREVNKIKAYLINIYFINDKSVDGPTSRREWLAALEVLKNYLGVGKHKLSKYMIDLIIDVEDLV